MLQLLCQVILEVLGWKGGTFQRDLIGKGLHGTNVHFTPEKSALLLGFLGIFLDGSGVMNLPANQEMPVQSLGQEDPLEKAMATHSSILVWRIPGTEEPGGLQSMRSQSQTRLSVHSP